MWWHKSNSFASLRVVLLKVSPLFIIVQARQLDQSMTDDCQSQQATSPGDDLESDNYPLAEQSSQGSQLVAEAQQMENVHGQYKYPTRRGIAAPFGMTSSADCHCLVIAARWSLFDSLSNIYMLSYVTVHKGCLLNHF